MDNLVSTIDWNNIFFQVFIGLLTAVICAAISWLVKKAILLINSSFRHGVAVEFIGSSLFMMGITADLLFFNGSLLGRFKIIYIVSIFAIHLQWTLLLLMNKK